MKIITLLFLLLISLKFISCSEQKTGTITRRYTEEQIRSFVYNAVKGDKNANDSLSGLIDYYLPVNDKFNTLDIKQFVSSNGKHFFTILLEYPNPVYNRFAIYDAALNALLVDKSLNGKLSLNEVTFNNMTFIELKEEFLSKDILELSRLTLYSVGKTAVVSFRIFSRLITPRNTYFQTITEVSNDRIRTEITSIKKSVINGKSDVFVYNDYQNKYVSNNNLFDTFVKDEINAIKEVVQKPEITDVKSALQSTGINTDVDTITNTSNTRPRQGFSITLDEGWREISNIVLNSYSKKNLKGSKFENSTLGAKFFVAQLGDSEKAEDYFEYSFLNVYEGKYKVRFTDKIETTKHFIQFFEFSCGNKKFILVFEASKYTYDKYKKIFEDITNSFIMDC